jgi:Flp pilus assembly protein CpaB
MLRRSPRAVLLWVAAAVVAIATAASVADVLVSLRHQDQAYGRVRSVVAAARDLPLGHRIRPADLTQRRLRGDTTGALTGRDAAVGKVVRVPVLRDAFVTSRHLTTGARDGRDGTVPAGLRAMRVVVDGGVRPRAGDPVDIYATFDPQTVGEGVEPTLTVAAAVPVLATDRDDGAATSPAGALGVTVLVTPTEAKRLAFATAAGTLAIAVAPPEATRR